jgi:CheY-like chemotaxis protein
MAGTGLLLSDDLLFGSRITGTAEALGLRVHTVRTAVELLRQAETLRPAGVLVDLHNPGLAIAEVVSQLKALSPPPRIIAYGSHVEAATLRQAREAGCDRVLPRSQFVEELPHALRGWLELPRVAD